MALQLIPGEGLWIPEPLIRGGGMGGGMTAMRMDASTEKIAFVGRFFHKDRTTKSITKIGFRTGTVTNSSPASTVRVSLQDVSATAGPPAQPDGTQDQTVDIGLAALTSEAWHQSAALSATRSLAFGELVAVVFEFSTFNAGAIFDLRGLYAASSVKPPHLPVSLLNTGSWAVQACVPNVILEADDGTFGTLFGAFPTLGDGYFLTSDSTNPDEHAMEFTLPFPCQVDGCAVHCAPSGTTADVVASLYSGTTVLTGGQQTLLAENTYQINYSSTIYILFTQAVTLAANTLYRLAVRANAAGGNYLYYYDVAANGHFQAHAGGTAWVYSSRNNSGSWSASTTTRRMYYALHLCACDDAVSGGGGGGGGVRLAGHGGLAA